MNDPDFSELMHDYLTARGGKGFTAEVTLRFPNGTVIHQTHPEAAVVTQEVKNPNAPTNFSSDVHCDVNRLFEVRVISPTYSAEYTIPREQEATQ